MEGRQYMNLHIGDTKCNYAYSIKERDAKIAKLKENGYKVDRPTWKKIGDKIEWKIRYSR